MKRPNVLQKYKIIDIRHLPEAHRDLRLLEAILCLEPGCSFLIKLDKSPKSLIGHLENELNDKFQWRMLQSGPEIWILQVTRNFNKQIA